MSDFHWRITVNNDQKTVYCTSNPAPVSVVLESVGFNPRKYILFPEPEAPETVEPATHEDMAKAPTRVDLDKHDRFVAVPKQRSTF